MADRRVQLRRTDGRCRASPSGMLRLRTIAQSASFPVASLDYDATLPDCALRSRSGPLHSASPPVLSHDRDGSPARPFGSRPSGRNTNERNDQWDSICTASHTRGTLPASVDFKADDDDVRFHDWRKHPDLHGWMEDLYREKGGTDAEFNCVNLQLTIGRPRPARSRYQGRKLAHDLGLLFRKSDGTERADDRQFIAKARIGPRRWPVRLLHLVVVNSTGAAATLLPFFDCSAFFLRHRHLRSAARL